MKDTKETSLHQQSTKQNQPKYDIYYPTRYRDLQGAYLPTRNQRIPAAAIKQDQETGKITESLKYYQGSKFIPENWKLLSFPKVSHRIDTLKRFYPRENIIVATEKSYKQTESAYINYALTTTALSQLTIFQFARRGKILPIFRKYGRFFGTHRVFRQYMYTAFLPIAFAYYSLNNKFVYHINHLWSIHAKRLNYKILDDSMGSNQIPLSGPFKVNIYKSIIPQEIDIQEKANSKLSLSELGDDEISDFQLEEHVQQSSEGEQQEEKQDAGAEKDEAQNESEGQDEDQQKRDNDQKDELKKAQEVAEDLDTRTGAEPDSITSSEYIKELGQPIQKDSQFKRKQQLQLQNQQQLHQTKKNVLSQSVPDIQQAPPEVLQKDVKKYKAREDLIRGQASPKPKLRISELDLQNLDIESIDLDELDLQQLGLDDGIDDATFQQQNQPRS